MNNNSIQKIFIVAGLLSLICSVLVCITYVVLRPAQIKNELEDRKINILTAAGIYEKGMDVAEAFEAVDSVFVDLETGREVEGYDIRSFDIKKAMKDVKLGHNIPDALDVAGIKRRPKVMPIYLLRNEDGQIQKYIYPVYGKGLWSTMYGFLSLEKDLNTIGGLTFYEHGETPGLGGEIDNPNWKSQWPGKKVYNEEGEVEIEVLKGRVDPNSPVATYRVDGISGATITARGVSTMLEYWLSDPAYGAYIENQKKQELSYRG